MFLQYVKVVIMNYTYYEELDESLKNMRRIVLRTEIDTYAEDCVDALSYLMNLKDLNTIIITFSSNTRYLVETLIDERKIDINKIQVIDAISIVSGKGTPPVPKVLTVARPDSFNEIEVYTNVFLGQRNFENTVIVFIGLHELEYYQNQDEIGMFLYTFGNMLKSKLIQEIMLVHTSTNFNLLQIISRSANKILPMRRKKIILGE